MHDAVLALIDTHGLRMQAVPGADNVHSQLQLVQAGLGLGILPDYVTAILPPGIVARPIDGAYVPTLGVCLAQRRDARLLTIASFSAVDRARSSRGRA